MACEIKIGVSACLLGEKVRYDGGHKHDRCITDILGRIFSFVPVCPEVECGLSVPREPMRLEGEPAHPRLVTIESRLDLTERLLAFCREKMEELEGKELSGFILKSRSPSCGLLQVPVYSGEETKIGQGVFAAGLIRHFPFLPVEEEGRLCDPDIREKFIGLVYAYRSRQEGHSSD